MKAIGVIGLGSIGARHARNLAALGCKVYGYDPIQSVAWPEAATPIDFLLNASEAIVIASPTILHAEHIGMAAKPTFVEKPIADRRFTYSPLVKMVGYNLRFHSCVKKAKEWIDSGLIGAPIWAHFTCAQYNNRPAYRRDGVILNWSHEIDLALYLLGPASVAASSTKLDQGQDVMTDILLTHENECRTRIHLDYLTDPERRGFVVTGTKAAIECDLPSRKIRIWKAGMSRSWIKDHGSYDQDYIEEMQAFLDRIDGRKTIGCTGEEAVRVLEVCLEARKQAGL